jgi:hypothetical protein
MPYAAKQESLYNVGGMQISTIIMERSMESPQKAKDIELP